jgi:hypothetical protein
MVWSSNMPANNALTTVHGLSWSPRPSNPLLHQIARWQLLSDGGSLLFSLRYRFLQLSLGAMGADRNAGFSRDSAYAHASRQ